MCVMTCSSTKENLKKLKCLCLNLFSFRSQMISAEDCEFIKKFEVANSEEKQVILTNEGQQVWGPAL